VARLLSMVLVLNVSQHPARKMGLFFGLRIGPRDGSMLTTRDKGQMRRVTKLPYNRYARGHSIDLAEGTIRTPTATRMNVKWKFACLGRHGLLLRLTRYLIVFDPLTFVLN
jgi:hypothetical protein